MKAVVVFSGGQDSTACLIWAMQKWGTEVAAIAFNYGQRHLVELDQADLICTHLGVELKVVDLSSAYMSLVNSSLMEEEGDVNQSFFVPGRNLVFMLFAAAWAYSNDCHRLVTGVIDLGPTGCPDTTEDSVGSMAAAIREGIGDPTFTISAPLLHLTKADVWEMTYVCGGVEAVDLVLEHTHTCFNNDRSLRHGWGYGCGTCHVCKLRREGWEGWPRSAAWVMP